VNSTFRGLEQQLRALRTGMRRRRKLERRLKKTEARLKKARTRRTQLRRRLQKESADVGRLKGLSFAGILLALTGKRKERLKREQNEFLRAKAGHREACHDVSSLAKEIAVVKKGLRNFKVINARYENCLKRKEDLIIDAGNAPARRLLWLSERRGDLEADVKDLREAVNAGRRALRWMDIYSSSLSRARANEPSGYEDDYRDYEEYVAARETLAKAAPLVRRWMRRFRDEIRDLGLRKSLRIKTSFSWSDKSSMSASEFSAKLSAARVERLTKRLDSRLEERKKERTRLLRKRRRIHSNRDKRGASSHA
jgi:hypothetical protein